MGRKLQIEVAATREYCELKDERICQPFTRPLPMASGRPSASCFSMLVRGIGHLSLSPGKSAYVPSGVPFT